MPWKDALLEFGIRLPDLIAGFSGGVVNAFVFKRSGALAVIGSVVVGAFTANYLGAPAAKMIGASDGAAAFIVGLAGMAICQTIVDAVKRWKPNFGNGGHNGSA